jgi:trans-2,3-dihydro-3-hydroxyanthranilate isomerase
MRYRIVDVFSERPLAGNPLCVVLDECDPSIMQAIAREMNLSETTFPTVTAPSAYDVRIFTPAVELPFAGHPSIGTAWCLGPGTWRQTSAGAVVTVEADSRGASMTQPDPEFTEVDTAGFAAAIGLRAVNSAYVASAAGNRFVIAATDDDLAAAQPDHQRIAVAAKSHDSGILCAVRRVDDRNLHVRVFAPGAGVAEDPGTGSAAGPIAVLARTLWSTDADVTIKQGDEIGRPCRIEVHAEDGNLRVGGPVAAVAEGTLSISR